MTMRLGFAIALSLSAGVIAWIGGRRMLRQVGDPLFVDRLFAHRVAMIRIYTFLIIVAAIVAAKAALWMAVLTLLSIAIGGFPARKTLYGETWTLPRYLASRIRTMAFAGGPWIAILLAPYMVELAGPIRAPLIFAVVLALFVLQQQLLLFGIASEPLRDEGLIRLFEPILQMTQAPRPAIFVGGSNTGRFANAFALPAGKRSRVVLTRALLRELEPVETAAIFAHESAHLEQWAKRGIRVRIWIGRVLLPVLAVAPAAIVMMKRPDQAIWVSVLWPVIFLVAMGAALIRRQSHESEADLRALELGADPRALINGLEKLHRLLGTPRRVDASREKRMTHPSLARRLQAIRKASGIEMAAAPPLPQLIPALKPGTSIQFTTDGLVIGEQTYRYDSLQSLLVQKTWRGWELAGRQGKGRIRVPIAADAAADVQTILDSIDIHFAQAATQPQIARSVRLTALLVLLLSLFPAISFPPVIAAIVALISAGAPALAAAGTTAIAAGLLALRHPSMPFLDDVIPAIAGAEILIGAICLLLIRKIPRPERQQHLRATLITLGVFVAIVLIPSLITLALGQPVMRLFLIARDRPSAAILFVGMAAALAVAGRLRLATAPAIAAIALFMGGTRMVGSMGGSDPLLTNRQPTWVAAPKPSAVRELDGMPTGLRLSPEGKAFAVRLLDDDDRATFGVGTLTSPIIEVNGTDLSFIDEHRLLRLDGSETRLQLDSIDIAGKAEGWRIELPQLWQPEVSAERNGEWRVSGRSVQKYNLSRISGRIGQSGYVHDAIRASAIPAVTSPGIGENAVVYAAMVLPGRSISPWLLMLGQGSMGTEFWRASGATRESIGRSVLRPAATLWLPDSGRWAIAGYDDRSTYVGTIDEAARSIRPSGAIDGRASGIKPGRGSRIVIHTLAAAIVWNLATGKAMRLACNGCMVLDVALTDHAVGVLWVRGETASLELYPTDSLQ